MLQGMASKPPGMPPACPVDRYVPCYRERHRSCLECHRLARWIVTFLATGNGIEATWNATGLPGGSLRSLLQGTASKLPGMPPACPVDRYVPCYRGRHRSYLECHRLARWIVTFLATGDGIEATWNATGLPGGSLRSLLQGAASVSIHSGTITAGGIIGGCVYRCVAMSVTIPPASRGHLGATIAFARRVSTDLVGGRAALGLISRSVAVARPRRIRPSPVAVVRVFTFFSMLRPRTSRYRKRSKFTPFSCLSCEAVISDGRRPRWNGVQLCGATAASV